MGKEQLRKEMRQRLTAMSEAERRAADGIIREKVLQLAEVVEAEMICIYVSLSSEVDTGKLRKNLLRLEKHVVVPGVNTSRLELVEIAIDDNGTIRPSFAQGFGWAKQFDNKTVGRFDVDLFIVPGLAFDKRGNRLGRGGGYYDRLLANVKVPKIGLAYGCQMVDKLVQMQHDIKMDKVISD